MNYKAKLTAIKTIAFCVSAVLIWACSSDLQVSPEYLRCARDYYEADVAHLDLPMRAHNTKGAPANFYPDWDNAATGPWIAAECAIQVPIKGNIAINGTWFSRHQGKSISRHAVCNSYLFFEMNGTNVSDVYVITILEKGLRSRVDCFSDKESFTGSLIKSDLNGSVISEQIFVDGNVQDGHIRSYSKEEISEFDSNFVFYGYRTVEKISLMTKGDDVPIDCYWYGEMFCRKCGRRFEGYVLYDKCPYCNDEVYSGLLVCEECGKNIDECTCDKFEGEQHCPHCGNIESECTCLPDDESHSGDHPDLCPECGETWGQCEHTNPPL